MEPLNGGPNSPSPTLQIVLDDDDDDDAFESVVKKKSTKKPAHSPLKSSKIPVGRSSQFSFLPCSLFGPHFFLLLSFLICHLSVSDEQFQQAV